MSRIIQAAAAEGFLEYVNASPTPFHAVRNSKNRLINAGFREISEKESWSTICKPGGKYLLTRNGSTIVAFAIGKKWKPGNPIAMIGTHTDSPCLRLKPVSKKDSNGFLQVGVEPYGGGLWHTWFDRDLGLAGRVMVRDGKGSIIQKLVHINRPILRIPTLAVHFERQEKFDFNKQDQLFPIAGLVSAELQRQDSLRSKTNQTTTPISEVDEFTPIKPASQRHHSHVVEVIAKEADVSVEDVVDFEIILFDTQKSCFGGLQDEFIFSARLDNLNSTYCATQGIIQSISDPLSLDEDSTIRLFAAFDNEEIGSKTTQGADSMMLPAVIRRLSVIPSAHFEDSDSDQSYDKTNDFPDVSTAYEQSLASSFLISADMAHSVNPNYAGKYDPDHRPEMNKGPVVKINANAKYTTNSPGIALIQEVAKLAIHSSSSSSSSSLSTPATAAATGVPLQLFVIRNDSLCGSTIGPMMAAKLGVRALDLGNPQLSMHSIRETCGTEDIEYGIRLFRSFLEHYGELEGRIFID